MTHKTPAKSVDTLLEIMRKLRSPGGCPWDAEQTPESLTPYIIEEACELVDAIEGGDLELIRDELGDLLLQVVFQAQIFTERGHFDFEDIACAISEKLIRRHPHVFAKDKTTKERTDLDRQWEEIKSNESTHSKSCLADHLPSKLPALQYAQKLLSKCCKAGREQKSPEIPMALREFYGEEITVKSEEINEETLGKFLFHLARFAQDAGIDAEASLRKTTRELLLQLDKK